MGTYIRRSDQDRRRAVNDLDHFAKGGVERRAYAAERRAYERNIETQTKSTRPRSLFQLFR